MNFNRYTRNIIFVAFCWILSACGGGGGGGGGGPTGVSGATSSLCNGITGATAIIYDLYNGIPRTDNGLPPPVPTGGGTFTHSFWPPLGFFYPGGYTPTQIAGNQNVIGVDVIRNDSQAVWRYLQQLILANPFASAREIRDTEVNQWISALGLQGTPTTVCETEGPGTVGGLPASVSSIMLQVGTHTMLVSSTMSPLDSLGCSGCAQLFSKVVIAPTTEFEALAYNTFLAMDWQLLNAQSGSLSDRDGDGVPDIYDSAPDDPTQQ